MPQQPLSFKIPNGKTEEVILVQLADGRVIARTRSELAELPAELREDLGPTGEPPK